MRVQINLNEEYLGEWGNDLVAIAEDNIGYEDPRDLIDHVREVAGFLEEWCVSARAKVGEWMV